MTAPAGKTALADLKKMAPVWAIVFAVALGSLFVVRTSGANYLRAGIFEAAEACQVAEVLYREAHLIWREMVSELASEQTRVQSSEGRFAGDPRVDRARELLNEAIEVCPSIQGAYGMMADLAWWEGDQALTHYLLAREHETKGEVDEAFVEYQTAYDLDPENERMLGDYVSLAVSQDRLDLAGRLIANASDEFQDSVHALRWRARQAQAQGSNDRALEYTVQALEKDPAHTPSLLNYLALTYYSPDSLERAIWLADLIEDAQGVAPTIFHRMAIRFTDLGEPQRALEMAEEGLERSQLNVYLVLEQALALEALGRHEEAQIALERAWTINPAIFMEALREARFTDFSPPQQ